MLSAHYLVDAEHIHVLVHAGLSGRHGIISWLSIDDADPTPSNGLSDARPQRRRALRPESASVVGQLLLDAHAASVNAQFGENGAYVYDYQPPARVFEPIEILKAIDGYDFENWSDPGWDTSEAYRYCYHLREAMIRQLPGYHDADTWHITPTTEALAEQRRRTA